MGALVPHSRMNDPGGGGTVIPQALEYEKILTFGITAQVKTQVTSRTYSS